MEIKEFFSQDENELSLDERLSAIEKTLEKVISKVDDNHRILKHEERSRSFKKFASVLKVAIIAGVILFAYFMAKPYLVKIQESYENVSSNLEKFQDTTTSIQDNVEKAEGFFGSFSDDLKGVNNLFDSLGSDLGDI